MKDDQNLIFLVKNLSIFANNYENKPAVQAADADPS